MEIGSSIMGIGSCYIPGKRSETELNSMSKLLDIIIAVAVMFLAVSLWTVQRRDYLIQRKVEEYAEEFRENVCKQGYISDDMYEGFTARLNSTGKICKVDMIYTQRVYEPEYEGETFTGKVMEYEDKNYTADILKSVYEKGAYLMCMGGIFEVLVYQKSDKLEQLLSATVSSRSDSCSCRASGHITGINQNEYIRYYR